MNIHVPQKSVGGLGNFGPSKCQKHLAKFCDINTMIQRAIGGDTSVFRHGSYVDLSKVPDNMQEMLNSQCRARDAYELLPAEIRMRFPSPQAFLDALSNPDRKQELLKLGVLIENMPNEPIKVSVVNPVEKPVSSAGTADPTSAPAR